MHGTVQAIASSCDLSIVVRGVQLCGEALNVEVILRSLVHENSLCIVCDIHLDDKVASLRADAQVSFPLLT